MAGLLGWDVFAGARRGWRALGSGGNAGEVETPGNRCLIEFIFDGFWPCFAESQRSRAWRVREA